MKMTLEQHREFGKRVKEFREILMQQHVACVGKKSSLESRSVENVRKHLERMRSALDSVVCRDFWECEDVVHIYYGQYTAVAKMGAASPNEL